MKALIFIVTLATACVPLTGPGIPKPNSVSLPGGSTYLMYSSDPCSGVIRNYDTKGDFIRANLRAMLANGQRRLSIMLTYLHEPQTDGITGCVAPGAAGTNMSSDLWNIDTGYYTNLAAYIKDASAMGFEEFVVIFGPQWNNGFDAWGSLEYGMGANPDGINYYAENFSVIRAVRQILVNSGVRYRLVLQDEVFHIAVYDPGPYVAKLWADYVAEFGLADTCGVTMANNLVAGDVTHEATQLREFLAAIDPVGRPNFYCMNTNADGFLRMHRAMVASGIPATVPIIVTSTALNDRQNAAELRAATVSTGRQILFLMQWFYNDPTVQKFNNYKDYGF